MKARQAFGCFCWALLYCVLYLDVANASSEDDLLDFDFMDAKEGDATSSIDEWQLDKEQQQQTQQAEKKLEDNMLDFSVDLDEPEPEKQLPPFDWREKVLRTALAKALTDRMLRQRFAEVMPILRVLSSQQRLALSALISAQMSAKQGHELKLEQVHMMFGNDRKLLLPIVFDLANLVKTSARKYIQLTSELATAAALRRKDELTVEESEQDDSVGTIDVSGKHAAPAEEEGLEDFFEGMQTEVLDPQMINEALQATNHPTPTPSTISSRVRRSATEFVHKLTRSVPVSVTEQQLLGGAAGRTVKLNTTAFRQPTGAGIATTTIVTPTQSYEEIENLAFEGLNGTEFSSSADGGVYQLSGTNSSVEEPLPNPEELIAGPHYRLNGYNNNKRPSQNLPPIKRKRVQSSSYSRHRPKTSASSHNLVVVPSHKKCERFTNNMCIRTDDYPLEQIMGSIRRHKNAMNALLAEFYDKPNNNLELGDDFDDFILNKKRREDEGSAGGMCQSVVRYARPQKAKAASGEWKFIVNTGQHTQTLRLEKCSAPGESCSYLAQTYRSHCSQVYNYHRLLSWDKIRGLHVDIFKVPTCCSCQVDGYRQQFPPLSTIQAKDYTPASNYKDNGNANGYSTINEEDFDDESDEDDLGLSYNPYNHRETNELNYLSSKKVRSKLPLPSSVGPYLSPPDDEEYYGSYKNGQKSSSGSSSSASSKKYYQQLSRRRPHHNEPRVDMDSSLDLAPSETRSEQEVNLFGPPLAGEQPQQRVPIKRKRIYSSTPTHTATTGGARIPLHVSHQPQTTASSSISGGTGNSIIIASSSLPARTGAAAPASGIDGAGSPYAHQTSVASGATASSEVAFSPGQRISYYSAGEKPRPRYYSPPGTTPAAPASATISASAATPLPTITYNVRQKQSTTIPQTPHLNSIYSNHKIDINNNLNHNHNNGSRRINYSYHPIIDFFENRANSRQDKQQQQQEEFVVGASQQVEQSYPKLTSTPASLSNFQQLFPTSHERRIGFGAGGGGVGGGASGSSGAGRYGYTNDNAWQPLVVDH